MNKTDRLLAIVLELQGKGRQRAEDLARTFETSKRTIYRDIEALCEAGVPIVSIPGLGYSLMEGYFLPPLSFTTDEATMLVLGSDLMAQSFDAQYRAAALAAIRKIEGVLPEALRDEVHYLQKSIRFIASDSSQQSNEAHVLQILRGAIVDRRTVCFDYYARFGKDGHGTATQRSADPYALIHFFNSWHLVAYCHLRKDMRHFRLKRIENIELLPQSFVRRPDVVLQDDPGERRNTVVRVLFDAEIVRWVREARSYYVVSEQETAEGLLVTLTVRQEDEVLHWLLSWGSHVRVLEPGSLRERLYQEAEHMLRNYHPTLEPSESRKSR